jgi:hypothetical protein
MAKVRKRGRVRNFKDFDTVFNNFSSALKECTLEFHSLKISERTLENEKGAGYLVYSNLYAKSDNVSKHRSISFIYIHV